MIAKPTIRLLLSGSARFERATCFEVLIRSATRFRLVEQAGQHFEANDRAFEGFY